MSQDAPPLLSIDDMSLEFRTRSGTVRALDHVSLSIGRGEIVGLVGESGSGKSVLCHALLGLSDRAARITSGRIRFDGIDPGNCVFTLTDLDQETWAKAA